MNRRLTSLGNVTLRDGSMLNICFGLNELMEIQLDLEELLSTSGFPDLDILWRFLNKASEGIVSRHFFGFVNNKLVAFLKYDSSDRVPYIGSLGYVFTAVEARGLGIAERISRQATTDFCALGGQALFLATHDPSARRIYEKVGFVPFNGDIMHYVVGKNEKAFESFYFGGRPIATIRDLSWGDWAMAAVLYGHPTSIHIRDYSTKLYSGYGQKVERFQSVIPPLLRIQEAGKGCSKVAEDTLGHLMGIGTLHLQGEGLSLVDFHSHPSAQALMLPLLGELLSTSRMMGSPHITMKVAMSDEAKIRVCQTLDAHLVSEKIECTGINRRESVLEMRFG